MTVYEDLRNQICAFVARELTLGSLREALATREQVAVDAGDEAARELLNEAWILVAELDHGEMDEAETRALLADLVDLPNVLDIVPWPFETAQPALVRTQADADFLAPGELAIAFHQQKTTARSTDAKSWLVSWSIDTQLAGVS